MTSVDDATPGATGEPAGPPSLAPAVFGARRAAGVLFAFLGVQIVVSIVVGVAAFLRASRAPGAGAPVLDVGTTLAAAFPGAVLSGLVALRMVRRALAAPGGEGARAAVAWARASARACVGAALLGLALVTAFLVVGAALPVRPHELGALARAAQLGGWPRALWAVLAVAVAPPSEELVFRGALYGGLARAWGTAAAAVVSTAVFVALHATEVGGYWPAWIAISTLGALALRLRVKTGSLLPAIALHAAYNLGLVLMAYAARA